MLLDTDEEGEEDGDDDDDDFGDLDLEAQQDFSLWLDGVLKLPDDPATARRLRKKLSRRKSKTKAAAK